jgi:LPS O-antigen subunit length determinant protein (WzzB/FepE family)
LEKNIQISNKFNDEIDLRELFAVLWAGKVKIIAITAIFAFASVIYALSLPNQYKATVLLVPSKSTNSGFSGALGQLGGLASLAGVSISGGESKEAQLAQEIMRSRSFIEDFVVENDLAVEVYAAQDWDKGSNKLQIDQDIYDTKSNSWLVEDDSARPGSPNSWKLYKSFSERLTVSEDKKSGFISVSIEYFSPQIAKRWLDLYISAINKYMQERQMIKVSRNIEYLEAQIEKTEIAGMQEVFYTIIEDQLKSKMLAEASPDYVFTAVSPSMVPEKKSQPKRALICVLGVLLGGMLSVLLVLVLHYARKSD